MWASQIDGPVLVRFQGREKNTEGTEQLRVYLDVRKIMSIEQHRDGGSTVVLTEGVFHDLHDSAAEVIERIRQAAVEMGLR
jgi:hypothetical protein